MARVIAWSRGTSTLLDTLTTPAGLSYVIALDTLDSGRARIYNGEDLGGRKLAWLDETVSAADYTASVPLSGDTINLDPDDRIVLINPAGPIATLNINLAPGVNKVVVIIGTRQRIDTLTIVPDGTDATDHTPNELPQNGSIQLRFVTAGGLDTWILI